MTTKPYQRIAIITGTTHGIGRVTALELARAGMAVVMLCRNMPAAEAVRADIQQQIPDAELKTVFCDLASLDSVHHAALQVRQLAPRFDLLINNAGMTSLSHQLSIDGFELVFATNHLGPFLLTELLRAHVNPKGRIVNVASRAHFRGKLDLHGIRNPNVRYRSMAAYDQSKLATVLHTFALARRMSGSSITVNCLHPGVVASNLLPRWLQIIKPWFTPVTFSNERGAQTTLKLALSEEVSHVTGQYFDEHGHIQPASSLAQDVAVQEELWEASERWTAGFR